MSRRYNNYGRDQFNIENIFHALVEQGSVFAKQIFLFFASAPLQSSHDPGQVQKDYVFRQEQLKIQQDILNHQINSSDRIIDIENKKIENDKIKIQLTYNYYSFKLNLIREYQAEKIKLKLQELQANWDVHNSPLIVSKQELFQLFNQQGYELSVLLAPPKITSNLELFNSLEKDLEYNLENILKNYYLITSESENTYCLVRYYQIFKRSIKKTEALHTSKLLKPFPTLIINSEITDRKVYVTVTYSADLTNSNNHNVAEPIDLPPWDWEEIKEALDSQGQCSKYNIRCVRDLIRDFHIVTALFVSDFYCLSLNPYHEHKLFNFLEERKFPEKLQDQIESYRKFLIEHQTSIISSIKPQIPESKIKQFSLLIRPIKKKYLVRGGILGFFLGMIILFGFCSQNVPNLDTANPSEKNSIASYQGKSGIIQVNPPDKKPVNLRKVPNGEVIDRLPDGTHVTLGILSSDRNWRKVTTQDGKSGWVWAEFVAVAP